MDLETAKKCVDLLFAEDARNSELVNKTDANGLIIEFIGGEPFLETDLIDRTMEYFLDRAIELEHRWAARYMINISTNGTLGDDPKVQQFMCKYAGRLSIGVTIDGDKAAHDACRVDCDGCGSYDRAIKMFRQTGWGAPHQVHHRPGQPPSVRRFRAAPLPGGGGGYPQLQLCI
jgi:sulfatase maturation enzyme AslB (radical SAM superfamily)